ncbi:HNH endonuclease [Vitreoscilla stercoraria]|uniref:HNH endonuclease n=1 Tax=Vitreoscilla stercoraria TaxID=61 RepID=A0ABY4EEM8_VITST|nr:HNH endonuclease signature motif containing protein [Vitreoscilla stercoraria]UOO93153.1 HNH endonuclease [Vitreoscilla stercoraria]
MSQNLFLDALIGRDDFEIQDQAQMSQGPHKTTLGYNDFSIPGFFFASLRKPDFQRETNEWDVEKVKDLVASFLDGDLIPAIILWKYADSYTFVIDGAHRISAIAAWVNDDYGDGKISRKFFDNAIPEEQIKIAVKARELINKEIGSFKSFEDALFDQANAPKQIQSRLKNFGTRAIQLQWVDGDAKKAEDSFFKINQKSTPISDTEMSILKTRRKPIGLCARAILRGGQGHRYWDKFQGKSEEIKIEAQEINQLIFHPALVTPIKTLDLPLGGKNHASNSLSMIFDLLTTLKVDDKNDDTDGTLTLKALKDIKKILNAVNSNHPSSLGLHPAIYIYSSMGNFRVSSFNSIIAFTKYLIEQKKQKSFTEHRENFEKALYSSEHIIQQIGRKSRQSNKAIEPLLHFYIYILDSLEKQISITDILEKVNQNPNFQYIIQNSIPQLDNDFEIGNSFSKSIKSGSFLRDALPTAVRCKICNGILHQKSISIDHIQRRQDGGKGVIDNAQLTHPYCNTTYKN